MAKLNQSDDFRLLVKVSKLYYDDNLTQDEIVEKLMLSRSKVSRLLQRARDEGIVRITVITPKGFFSDLETRVENYYHIREVVVVEASPSDSQDAINRQLGIAAAEYLRRTVRENQSIGISWGSTLNFMVEALKPVDVSGLQVVQIIGGLGQPEAEVHATDLSRRMARMLGGRLMLLPAPGIVDNLRTKEAFLSDSHVQRTLESISKLDVIYVGIGAPTPESLIVKDGSIITPTEVHDLLSKGAVGDIALHFFDIHGHPILSEIDSRLIGATLEQLSQVSHVVGITGGADKHSAVLGALRGNLIDVLITDSITAETLLSAAPE